MEIDMSAQHPKPPPARPSHVGRVAVVISIVLFLLGLVLYISGAGDTQTSPQSSQEAIETNGPSAGTTPKAARVAGQVIVKFKESVTSNQITQRLLPLNASIKSQISGINVTVLTVPQGKEDDILKELAADPLVQYAEPDYVYYLEFTPNDTQFGLQWGFVNTGQTVNGKVGKADADIDAEFAWDVSRGTGVTVAILDSGIDTSHPELASKVKSSKTFTSAGVADKNGHGTHVAGILAANTNNGQGVAGVCPDCQLLIGKITNDDSGGTVPGSAIAPGITWAADSGAQVINMSIAGPSYSQAVQDAVNYAWSKNVVVVAAAGNSGSSTKAYPGAYENVIAVGNATSTDARRSDSNYGTWVDVAAPGDNIYSTLPTTASFIGKTLSYGYLSGTSMASPAVAGIAALVWKTQYGTNNAAVVQRIFTTAEKISGTGTYWVQGRVNAASAVGASTNPSTAPSTAPANNISIIPTFVCGGSTNSICPIPSVSNPLQPSGSTNPTSGATNPTGVVPSGSVSPAPCETGSAAIANKGRKHKSKHKKKSHGGVSEFINALLRFFIELINMLLKLIGGGQMPVPTVPTDPIDPISPVDPCDPISPVDPADPTIVVPTVIASLPPSSQPQISNPIISNPVVSGGKPVSNNTGVPAGTQLKVVEGNQTFATDNQVISGLDINGKVIITGKNVILKNSIIRGPVATSCKNEAIIVAKSVGVTIQDTEVIASHPTACLDGVWISDGTLIRMNIHGGVDGVKAGNNVLIQDSYIHDLNWLASDPNQGGKSTHNDGVQSYVGNSNITLRHNNIDLSTMSTANATYQVTQDGGGRATNLHIENNWLDGGGCTLNFSHKGGPVPMTGIYVVNNRFGRHRTFANCTIVTSTQTVLTQNIGNVWDDNGQPIPSPQRR